MSRAIIMVVFIAIFSSLGFAATGGETAVADSGQLIAYDTDGRRIVCLWGDGHITSCGPSGAVDHRWMAGDAPWRNVPPIRSLQIGPANLMAFQAGDTTCSVVVYDLSTGQVVEKTELAPLSKVLGWSSDGRALVVESLPTRSVSFVDCATGTSIWSSGAVIPSSFSVVKMTSDRTALASFDRSSLAGVDLVKHKDWTIPVLDGRRVQLGPNCLVPRQALIGNSVVFEDRTNSVVNCIDVEKGTTSWTSEVPRGSEILAVSKDGQSFTYRDGSSIELKRMPGKAAVRLPVEAEDDEIRIVDNDLVCDVAPLIANSGGQMSGTLKLARRTSKMNFFDGRTGDRKLSIDLEGR